MTLGTAAVSDRKWVRTAAEPGAFVFANDLIENARARLPRFSELAPRVTTQIGSRTRSRINFAGRGVVVTTVCGSAPSRIPNISMSR